MTNGVKSNVDKKTSTSVHNYYKGHANHGAKYTSNGVHTKDVAPTTNTTNLNLLDLNSNNITFKSLVAYPTLNSLANSLGTPPQNSDSANFNLNSFMAPESNFVKNGFGSPTTNTNGFRSPTSTTYTNGFRSPTTTTYSNGFRSPTTTTFTNGFHSPTTTTFTNGYHSPTSTTTNGLHSPTTTTTSNFITSANMFNANSIVPSNFVKPAEKQCDTKNILDFPTTKVQQSNFIENSNIFDALDFNGIKSSTKGINQVDDNDNLQHFWDARMKDIADAMTYLELI